MESDANKKPDQPQQLGTRGILTLVTLSVIIVMTFLLRYQQHGFGRGEVVIGEDIKIKVEVAATEATREKGLAGRTKLMVDEGMLFLFAEPARYVFWMKDMKIPIDVIWIKSGEIVDLTVNVQPAEKNEPAPTFSPLYAAEAVLEVPAGFIAEHGLRLGLPVIYRIDRRGALR
ncbi:DUF192 domain-containing protein [Patescibacteria group bacterium]|nr:DUF192 domain-containing protein [Patescibacteria group bacterium]MBU1028995.1 DUF192 domain-containing protein [Patescibacteria group bacterium]